MESDESRRWGFWHHKASFELNSKIMLSAVISLTVVVIFVIILHIYARIVLRRRARTGQQPQGHTVTQINLTEPPKRGLDPSIIAALPVFVFKQANPNDESHCSTLDNNVECAVCLSMLEGEETARLLPNCKHIFHAECIDKWLSSNSTCPVCRTEAQPRVQPEEVTDQEADNGGVQIDVGVATESSVKVGGSCSRISPFRRMLSRERSSTRIQYCGQHEQGIDLERQ